MASVARRSGISDRARESEREGEGEKHTKRLVRPLERELLHHAVDPFELGELDCVLRVPRVAGGPDLDGEAVCELFFLVIIIITIG
jgi:hypothetical protein